MDYEKFSLELIAKMHELHKVRHQKKMDEGLRGEAMVLNYIETRGDCLVVPSEISEVIGISTARVAIILNNCEDEGLVTREIDKSDRRRIIVKLTQKGRAVSQEKRCLFVEKLAGVFSKLGERDSKEYLRITGKLAEIIAEMKVCEGKLCLN